MPGNRIKKNKLERTSISPDEIFLDSKNIPNFDSYQLEGRMEKPISPRIFGLLAAIFLIIGLFLAVRAGQLQIVKGESLANRAENNRLQVVSLPVERGLIYDRRGELLAWNEPEGRKYKEIKGLAHIVGYLGYPLVGKDGVERSYEDVLAGEYGLKIIETDSRNEIKSETIQKYPRPGESLRLSVDYRLQEAIYKILSELALEKNFQGASCAMVDVRSGEILSLVSYPEYSSQILTDGRDDSLIQRYIVDPRKPFLNRSISGVYTPGSVIKPFMALAALNEKIIGPDKKIFSSGSIAIPNPYNADKESVFFDWKAHGWVDMRKALAVSSNVYFYTIGGGFEDIKGLGISRMKEYLNWFGFGKKTGIDLIGEAAGFVPGPAESVWRIGDTYNVSIGQAGFLVTPLQMAMAAAFLASDGSLIKPSVLWGGKQDGFQKLDIPKDYFEIVKEGMRMAVTEGTVNALNWLPINFAAKTGTAELGSGKYVNSWLIAFWPYENPQYALSIVMEKGSSVNLVGAVFVAKQLADWMFIHTPEYLGAVDESR